MEELQFSTEESVPREALLDSRNGFPKFAAAWLVGLVAASFLVAVACDAGLLRATTSIAETVGVWLFALLILFALA
jgi:hypothetical protein